MAELMRQTLRSSRLVAWAVALGLAGSAQTRVAKTLDIYVVDVEGGNATLFVSPAGEALLIDAGNGGAGRFATRSAVPPAGTNTAPPPAHNGAAYWITVTAQSNGSFTVTNARNGFSKTYRK